tara:strand:- start:548 stop:907 length:360 start_codon:yes stop_codon:yes gene_type:complete
MSVSMDELYFANDHVPDTTDDAQARDVIVQKIEEANVRIYEVVDFVGVADEGGTTVSWQLFVNVHQDDAELLKTTVAQSAFSHSVTLALWAFAGSSHLSSQWGLGAAIELRKAYHSARR